MFLGDPSSAATVCRCEQIGSSKSCYQTDAGYRTKQGTSVRPTEKRGPDRAMHTGANAHKRVNNTLRNTIEYQEQSKRRQPLLSFPRTGKAVPVNDLDDVEFNAGWVDGQSRSR